jgi:uncharacterized protein (DUF2225 family)
MTTLRQLELRCPICEAVFRSQAVVSTNAFGGKRTDFHERAAGTQPLAYLIHMCSECGFSGSEKDFTPEGEVSPLVRARVLNRLSLVRAPHEVSGSEKYEAAAKVAEWQGMEARHIADLLLRAAWCCVDEGDVEAERYFRRHAAWAFERALENYDTVPRDERAVLTYLVGELWRRTGDPVQAKAWFDLVPDEVTDEETQKWIVDAARQQSTHPREWFG